MYNKLQYSFKISTTERETTMKKTKDQIQPLTSKVLYMNKPISDSNADEIGVGVYVDYLENAIEKGADMIAVISGFGTGKSSLIELLKAKYHGWKIENCWKRQQRVYCQVNLWSQLETGGTQEEAKSKSIDLHRSFLYQLIASVYPHKSSYFSRRTGRNFGLFKISAESPFWSALINITMVIFLVIALAHYFAQSIVVTNIISEKMLNLIILIGYSLCAIVVISLFLRTEIIFSSKNSEKNREIEENELIDLYKEHVLLPKTWWRRLWSKIRGTKHIVVIIEDLDRTEAGDSVYLFLKELRKYYVPDEQQESNFMNRITFLVNIMPEDKLQKKCKKLSNPTEYIYDKVFDYSFNLNRINIDNFDVVLEALIRERKTELDELGIKTNDTDNVHKIAGMQWIVLGKNLSIRQVKDRLNEAIVLYDSIKDKFGSGKADFEKCAAVAYLRTEFPIAFHALEDRDLEEMVTSYAKNQMDKLLFVSEYCREPEYERFYERLYDMIEAHLIDENYRSYFYNYPKDSHLYTIRETRVRNLIIYNEKVTESLKEDIAVVVKERPEAVVDAMQRALELVSRLPEAVLFSTELWNVARSAFSTNLLSLVMKEFSQIKEVLPEHIQMLDSVVNMQDSATPLCNAILQNDVGIVAEIRGILLAKHIEKVQQFIPLFQQKDKPLTMEELNQMIEISLTHVLDMVKGNVVALEDEVLDAIHSRVLKEKDEDTIAKAEHFYMELIDVFGVAEVFDYVRAYMIFIKRILLRVENEIMKAIADEKLEAEDYFSLLNELPIKAISTDQLASVEALDVPGKVNKEICEKLKEEGYYKTYLVNMIVSFPEELQMEWTNYYHVCAIDGKTIWTEYPETFKKIRSWGCEKFKDEMVQLEDYFKAPYPLITNEEMQSMIQPDTALQLYDGARANIDEGEAFVQFCNRQFRKSDIAFSMFHFVASMEKSVIETVFYKLDMKKVRFSLMGAKRKLQIVEELRVPLNLNKAKEIVRFMDFTECLITELEKEIEPDLKEDEALSRAYIKAIQKSGKVSDQAYKNIFKMPNIYAYGELINEKLYEAKEYVRYICSKTQEENKFVIEYEKLDVLWDSYIYIFKNAKRYGQTAPRMRKNVEFLKLVQNRNAYNDLPEESRLALADIPQDEGTLLEVLNYTDEFVEDYFAAIVGFSSKKAEETFVKIMGQHQKYAQKSTIYENVYPLMKNPQLKGQYTKLYRVANSE